MSCSFRSASACVRKHPRLTSAELTTQNCVSNRLHRDGVERRLRRVLVLERTAGSWRPCRSGRTARSCWSTVTPPSPRSPRPRCRSIRSDAPVAVRSRTTVPWSRRSRPSHRSPRASRVVSDRQTGGGRGVLLGREADVARPRGRRSPGRLRLDRSAPRRRPARSGPRPPGKTAEGRVVLTDQARLRLRALARPMPFARPGSCTSMFCPGDEDLRLAHAERVDPVPDVLEGLLHHGIRRVRRALGGSPRRRPPGRDPATASRPRWRTRSARRRRGPAPCRWRPTSQRVPFTPAQLR